jgi:hypothetical protein
MRPHPELVRTYLARGAKLWLATRAMVSVVFLYGHANPVELTPMATGLMVLSAVFVSCADTHRHGERALLGNLGLETPLLVAIFAVPAVLGEIAIKLTVAAVT